MRSNTYWNSATGEAETAQKPRKPAKTALVAADDILARQEYSSAKLREKLARKGYTDEEIDAALARLVEKHYLDDAAACQRQFDYLYHESRQSVRQICLKLQQRGFARADVQACVPQDNYEREKAAAMRTLALKYKRTADKQKMLASLYRSGFDNSALRDAVETYINEEV